MSVGKTIKKLRTEHEMTQEDLAKNIYVTRNAVSKWETDKGIPSIDSLKQLSTLFNVPLDYLVSEEDRIVMVLDNSKKIESYKDYIAGFSVFLTYFINGIGIPLIFISVLEYGDNIVNYILLPLVFMFIGIISVIREIKWKYLLIASALGLIPIYVLYDVVLPEYSLGLFGIIHYILFVGSYFLSKLAIFKLSKKFTNSKLMNIFLVLTILVLTVFVVHTTINTINLSKCVFCSEPWYYGIVTNLFIYAIPISIPSVLYYHFKEQSEVNEISTENVKKSRYCD